MDLFFIKIQDVYRNAEKVTLSKIQHELRRRLLAYLLEKRYNIADKILVKNCKPKIRNNPIFFSIRS